MSVSFTVPGVPAPQGSKNQFGGEANPRTRPWRAAVAIAASGHLDRPYAGPVKLHVDFYLPRPKGHYGTGKNAQTLKSSAPRYKAGTPDLDKLLRAIGDALTGILVRDDAQIVSVTAWKLYGESPRADIQIVPLEEEAVGITLELANKLVAEGRAMWPEEHT